MQSSIIIAGYSTFFPGEELPLEPLIGQ